MGEKWGREKGGETSKCPVTEYREATVCLSNESPLYSKYRCATLMHANDKFSQFSTRSRESATRGISQLAIRQVVFQGVRTLPTRPNAPRLAIPWIAISRARILSVSCERSFTEIAFAASGFTRAGSRPLRYRIDPLRTRIAVNFVRLLADPV